MSNIIIQMSQSPQTAQAVITALTEIFPGLPPALQTAARHVIEHPREVVLKAVNNLVVGGQFRALAKPAVVAPEPGGTVRIADDFNRVILRERLIRTGLPCPVASRVVGNGISIDLVSGLLLLLYGRLGPGIGDSTLEAVLLAFAAAQAMLITRTVIRLSLLGAETVATERAQPLSHRDRRKFRAFSASDGGDLFPVLGPHVAGVQVSGHAPLAFLRIHRPMRLRISPTVADGHRPGRLDDCRRHRLEQRVRMCASVRPAEEIPDLTREAARDRPHPLVTATGMGEARARTGTYWAQQPDFTATPQVFSAPAAFGMAGIAPADVDVLTLYDPFTIVALMQIEDMGFCPKGEGGAFVEGARLFHDGGGLPYNTHGGLLSHAYVLGIAHVVEVVRQLRGEAAAQVPGAEIGVYGGYTGATASTLVLRSGS